MGDITKQALTTMHRQHGVLTTRQLRNNGVGLRTQLRLLHAGVLIHDSKSVLRLAGTARSLEQRCASICLTYGASFITGATAGTLMGLRRMPKSSKLTVSAPHPLHFEQLGVLVRRSTKVGEFDVTVRPDGIRIAAPARLAFDLASTLGDHAHRSVVEQMLHEKMVTEEQLAAIARRLIHPARRGSSRFHHTLCERSGAAFESEPELIVAEALRRRGVPVIAQETWLELPNGRRARLDLSIPEHRWGVEVDVHPTHLNLSGTTADKQRDRQCHLIGWQIERVTGLDLYELDAVADELVALYKVRTAQVA